MNLKIKVFADGARVPDMLDAYRGGRVQGFTTNPTLMRKAGVTDYEQFARETLAAITDLPISFEVFADDLDGMLRQARHIAKWGANVYVKIPVTNTKGESTAPVQTALSRDGIKLNVTAVLTTAQVREVVGALHAQTPAVVSVFAGRIADTGRDPIPLMREALEIVRTKPQFELLWASPRELLNIVQADAIGCHIITVTNDLLAKLANVGKDLSVLSLETVRMFYNDAAAAGYTI
jgi:transaldolase